MIRQLNFLVLFILITLEVSARIPDELQRFEFTHKSMGTLFRIVCYAESEELAQKVTNKAFQRIDELNQIMSDYSPDSELNRLSRQSGNGKYIEVSEDLYKIINLSYQWSQRTNGVFDVTIGPYSQLWRRAGRKESLPTTREIREASKSVGYKYIRVDPDRNAVLLSMTKMQLDLGGIAKGFAVDEVFQIFKESGIDRVLIDGGGDIRVGEPPPGKPGWRVVLENMEKNNQVIYLSNASIATSGDLYRYILIDSVKYGHIIDPRTGYGLTVSRTVTIQSDNCTEADVLASVISILGPDEGMGFLSSIPDVKVVIVQEENGNIVRFEKGALDYVE
jgi:thiamine biosynthesis lipoprotein